MEVKVSVSHSIPLIRSGAIAPMRRWLSERGRDSIELLKLADLAWVPEDDPFLPIPLRNAVFLLAEIAKAEGPDAPHRIVNGRSALEIGLIGAMALQGPTVGEGLFNVAKGMPLHCTHEIFTIESGSDGLHVGEGWAINLGDQAVQHVVQQYVLAIVDTICGVAAGTSPCVSRVSMVPHPEQGFAHLRQWLGERVFDCGTRTLEIFVEKSIAELPIPEPVRQEAEGDVRAKLRPLRRSNTLSGDLETIVISMLPRTRPTVDRLAFAAGMSGRSLRRRLFEEGTSFARIVEHARVQIAISRLKSGARSSLKDLADELGYADQATLTRAVRRWTGKTPRELSRAETPRPH